MASFFGVSKKTSEVRSKVIPGTVVQSQSGVTLDTTRFALFWDMMDTLDIHGYVRAAMSVIGRGTVGTWWNLVKHPEYETEARDGHRKKLYRFYTQPLRNWDNIKDFHSVVYKFMVGAMYLKYFGQCAYKIVRNPQGLPVGMEFLHGYVHPNVDGKGYFNKEAFIQYPTKNVQDRVVFKDPKDIIFIANPDWRGRPSGSGDMESTSSFSLPIDIYLQTTAREYLKNRDRPEAFYILPSDVSDEAFETFSQQIRARYAGPANAGKSPITVAGELDIKEMSGMPTDLPYGEARLETRKELLATAGVSEAKMGLTAEVSNSNFKEIRREFHESVMLPLFRMIEAGFYEQIHIREFGVCGWLLQFNSPDFLNMVERATVDMRYYSINSKAPNEIRRGLGMSNRKDPDGDLFLDQLESRQAKAKEQATVPQDEEPEDGTPPDESDAPERGDQHDDSGGVDRAITNELRTWKKFAINRRKDHRPVRKFSSLHIPDYLSDAIQRELDACDSPADVSDVFSDVFRLLEEK
jgi:hypothetical protein